MIGKRLVNTGVEGPPDPLQNFETVTYTGNGGTQKITGYIRKGAAFNGSSSKVETTLTQTNTSAWSWSFWVNVQGKPSAGNISAILSNMNGSSPFAGVAFIIDSPNFGFASGGSGIWTSNTVNPNLNQWYHIAITYDGTNTITPYVDGTSYGAITHTPANGNNLTIGDADVSSWGSFNGKIDQVRIFDKALSQSEVDTLEAETYDSSTKSTTDIFGDGSGVALYELDEDANESSGTSSVPTHYFYVTDGGSQSSSARLNSVDSEFTYSRPSGYSEWGGTFDPSNYYGSQGTLSESNKKWDKSGTYYNSIWSANGYNTGKYYFELEFLGVELSFGITKLTTAQAPFNDTHKNNSIQYVSWATTSFKYSTTNTNSGVTLSTNNVIGFAVDFDNQELKYYRNNTLIDTVTIASTNYNGTPTNVNFLGMAFQPDLVWTKSRSNGLNHTLFDSIRGTTKSLRPNSTTAEQTRSGVTSFDSNGFTIGTDDESGGQSGYTYVSWCWKAGGAAVSNTDGGNNSAMVSANPDAGFSIITYTGNNTNNSSVGHGLNQAPEMFIYKRRSSASPWIIVHKDVNNYQAYLEFTTGASTNDSAMQSPTDSVIRFNTSSPTFNGSGQQWLIYAFHSVDGYQKVGSYSGTGAVNNQVNVGFQPRFVMQKKTSGTGSWNIIDNLRGDDNYLSANLSNAEGSMTASSFHLTSTGFTLDNSFSEWNASGGTYIYLAIA